ncbi:MAG: sirohydrochlorin chelatase [Jhaorihella sp.]
MAHGQPSEPAPPEEALARLAGRVADHLPGWLVRSATMAMPGRLEEETANLADGAVIYPFFMAGGWFVTQALPRRLGDRRFRIASPLGLEPGLPDIAARAIRAEEQRRGGRRDRVLVLAAHGSGRGTAAADAALGFAGRLAPMLADMRIVTGFVEQTPGIAEVAAGAGADALCLPFFAFPGDHVRRDIPHALARAGFAGTLMPVLGMDDGVPGVIAATLRQWDGQSGES